MRKSLAIAIGLVGATTRAISSCGDFPTLAFGSPETAIAAEYQNANYGYVVRVPKGLIGYRASPSTPDHGLGIVIRSEPRAYLYVDGSYNAAEQPNLQSLGARHAKWLKSAGHVLSVQQSMMRLGSLRALRRVSRYTCSERGGVFVQDEVIALSADREIVYTVALLTTDRHYVADRRRLEQLIRSWHSSPIE